MLLARGGSIASDSLIGLLDAYKNETSEAVWELISLTISELRKFVETDPRAHKALRAFAVRLARTQYQQLGWNPHANEPESNTKLRATIIGLMVYGEDPDTSAHAQSLYYSQHMRTLEPDLRPLIIAATVRDTNDPAIIDTLLDLYHTTTSPDLRQDIMRGLAATRTAAHISRFLQLIITGSIRQQDVAHWFALLIRNPHARPIAWQWLRENWQWIETTFHSDKSYDAFPRYASVSLTTPEQLQEYHDFFTPLLKEPALTRTIRIGLAEIQGNIALIEKDGAAVRKTLIEL
jgi:aminopeptidase N